ncbi:GH25 family lysozyme [Dactylosporangium sp. NPDC048998]|uniref:GH25 family lysozyme n=1 Tax=Dactylosporangium sp. NPDC048998 TaxID=3363976 RepID=UPI0037105E9F
MPKRWDAVLDRAGRIARSIARTPWQRRTVAASLLLLTGSLWGVSAASPGRPALLPAEPPSLQAVAAIQAGRPAGFPVGGIDLSSHDHGRFTVHWPTEVAAGSQFVYIKATEGTGYVNPHFAADYAAARAAGRYVGAYVYARPDRGDPVGQAEFFLRHAKFTRDARTLVPFVDLEWPYAGVRAGDCYDLTPQQMRAWIRAFVDRIEAGIGRKPMIYTNTYWWNPCTGNDASYGGYPLDIANYSTRAMKLPAGWSTFALWQYQPGDPEQRHSHDRDVVNGGPAGLRALAWPPPPGG